MRLEGQESARTRKAYVQNLFGKTKKLASKRGTRILRRLSTDIPIANWFRENPLGNLVALFLLFMIVYLWSGNLPTNPYVNDANFVSQWLFFYNTTKWMLTIAIPGFIIGIALSAVHEGAQREQGFFHDTGLSNLTASIRARTSRIGMPKPMPKPEGLPGAPIAGKSINIEHKPSDQGVG